MADSVLKEFLRRSTEERLRLAASGTGGRDLAAYLGKPAYEEYLKLARQVVTNSGQKHLAPMPVPNLIFIPGVMGSLLHSPTLGGVWWIDLRSLNHIDRLALDPSGERDSDQSYEITPFTVDTTYEPFLAALNLSKNFRHITYPYDWRKPLYLSADGLRKTVIDLYKSNNEKPVHVVAHSMGGLLLRATLMKHYGELGNKLGRIVFIGTPHYGSPAIASYLKNHLWGFDKLALLGLYLSRETFRSMWGVLSLLPAPRGIYPGTRNGDNNPWQSGDEDDPYVHPCANFDLYDAGAWKLELDTQQSQLGLVETQQQHRLQDALDHVSNFHKELYDSHWKIGWEIRRRMAVIAGVGVKTLYRLAYGRRGLGLWESMDKVKDSIRNDPHRQGDGRVPLASAELEDVGDVRYVNGVHGELPMIPQVYEDVFRWLSKEEMRLPRSPSQVSSKHLGVREFEQLSSSLGHDPLTGDVDLWRSDVLNDEQLAQLRDRLTRGELPDFIKVKLM